MFFQLKPGEQGKRVIGYQEAAKQHSLLLVISRLFVTKIVAVANMTVIDYEHHI